jgi:monoamine oxidase
MNSNFYDIIIIGAGLSGLYSAYSIKKLDPSKKFLILESNKKPYIGGRVGNDNFYGSSIVVGAGVGRKDTDKLLIKLLNELDIDFKPFKVLMNYSSLISNPINVKNCLAVLRQQYKNMNNPSPLTFKQFAKQFLGNKNYERFIISAGYRDYEEEDDYYDDEYGAYGAYYDYY